MNRALLIILFFASSSRLFSQSADSIFERSGSEQKNVFLVFSGSDWCQNCMRFEKKVLKDQAFIDFISGNLLYIHADFPQRKKLSSKEVARNEKLAEEYNPQGLFPSLFLVSPRKKVIPVSYEQETAIQFIDKLKKVMTQSLTND